MADVRETDAAEITRAGVVNDDEGRDLYAEATAPWRPEELLPESLRGAGR